ncbi:phenylacetyl-CoA ligase [Infundibulicybe gibba]|nr:phenylacetyl-CoA ligase [Infundibulicybe gibba]
MSEVYPTTLPLPLIPDNLTIPQFIFDTSSAIRPVRPSRVPWLIEDESAVGLHHAELQEQTEALANALHIRWNIVCIFGPNDTQYPLAIWAVHQLGGVITPANPGYKTEELNYQLRTTKAALIFVHPACLDTALSAASEVGLSEDRIILFQPSHGVARTTFPDQKLQRGEGRSALAFLSFSSGTTGQIFTLFFGLGVIANVIQMATHFKVFDPSWKDKRMVPGDTAIAGMPFNIYGLVVNLHFLLFCGLSIVVVPKFNFSQFLKSIERHRITHLFLVPPQIVLLCKHPQVREHDFSHVKFCISGAAPLSGELMQKVAQILPNASIGQGYGLTETCTTIAMISPTQKFGAVGSAGQIIPGIATRVIKTDGTLAKEGEAGELIVSGPSMAMGYINNADATKETFLDGWVRTGDEVIIKNRELYVVDRLKEIMKVRGFQVAPAELEGHLLMHPDVADACVVGVPDDYSGEIPLAYIVPSAAAAKRTFANREETAKLREALIKFVADAKIQYKWLAGGVEFIDAIPKNPSGKMLRRVLRDQAKQLMSLRQLEEQLSRPVNSKL